MSTPKLFEHWWGPHDWGQYRTGTKVYKWPNLIPEPEPTQHGEAMTPTTSDRFFALAARVESALPDAGLTKEQAAELVDALRAYWEQPSEQALEALKGTQERVLYAAIREGRLKRGGRFMWAYYALDRAAQAFFANEPEPFTGRDASYYLDGCEGHLGAVPAKPAPTERCLGDKVCGECDALRSSITQALAPERADPIQKDTSPPPCADRSCGACGSCLFGLSEPSVRGDCTQEPTLATQDEIPF